MSTTRSGIDSSERLKEASQESIEAMASGLFALSRDIHSNPELSFEEYQASEWTASMLGSLGMDVETGVCDLPTAFVATAGSGPLVISVCAEYDALPGVGHACGHNVIAASAVGAAAGLVPLLDEIGVTLKVMGTPAEEGGGGKILMMERGAFDGVHASMMVHPAPHNSPQMECLAVSHIQARYQGRASHASGAPELGINAADALTVAQVSIGLLRQHIPLSSRVHGIITKGGDAANIVPEVAEGEFFVRAKTLAELSKLNPRIHRCFEAGALATGCELTITELSPDYSEFRTDQQLLDVYLSNAKRLGRADSPATPTPMSTDMANVSLSIPSLHPLLAIDSGPYVNHQAGFAKAAISPSADRALLDGSIAMAWTTIDLGLGQ